MSLKYNIVLVWAICLSCKVVLTGCEVVLVNRNVTDSFRVGNDGCKNNASDSVCTSLATCQSDGSCLCRSSKPNFRNPNIIADGARRLKYDDSYGCVSSQYSRFGFRFVNFCEFGPFQLIPSSHQDSTTKFTDINNQNVDSKRCALQKAWVKFPDNAAEMELQWLNHSYVDLTVFNATLDFRWKRSVPDLRGTIITLHLACILEYSGSATFVSKCLRAKVLGTWSADAVSVPTEPTVTATSSQPKSSQITTEATSSVTVTTAESKSTASASSDDESPDLSKVFIALFSISLVVILALGIVVVFLWKKMQRMKDNNLRMKEMQNIDGQKRATTGDDIGAYDEVVTKTGIHNDVVIYDESFPSSTHNNNNGGHKYEEPSNYEPLRRNPLQDQNDEHNYESLTTSQKGK